MNDYSIALFLHIVGALGFFVALGVQWMSVRQLRRATTAEHLREWIAVATGVRRVGMALMAMLLIPGFYMMATVWGPAAWIIVTLATLVVLTALAVALPGPRMAAIGRAVTAETGPLSLTLHKVVLHPLRDGISIFNSGVAYGAIHNVGVFGLMFQLFGLVGLYIREADTMGRRGLIAFSDKRTKQSHRAPFLESVRSQRPGRLE